MSSSPSPAATAPWPPCSRSWEAFAEFERALIKERQREGIALAKQRGAYRGRRKALTTDQVEQLRAAACGQPKAALAREFGISRETVYHVNPRFIWF